MRAAHGLAVVQSMQVAFAQGQFEAGLSRAVETVTAFLVQHFPRSQADAGVTPTGLNELPDAPAVL